MKLRLITLACVGLMTIQAYAADEKPVLANDQDKLSYAIGVDIGNNFKNQNIQINSTILMQGINDAINGQELLLPQVEVDKTLQAFQTQLIDKRQAELVQQAEKNQQQGDKFLAENKTKPGIITLPSGLQYKVIEAGSGQKPMDQDIVNVEYTGRLINGKVFDSSAEHGGKVSFQVNEVIPGWQEALKLMPVGSIWEVYIPAKLAYGERTPGGVIGPNETLIFNLHLLEVNPNKAPVNEQDSAK
jgi:FKBP-type peptidyl-prolyl cis-trans isomerase FklB